MKVMRADQNQLNICLENVQDLGGLAACLRVKNQGVGVVNTKGTNNMPSH